MSGITINLILPQFARGWRSKSPARTFSLCKRRINLPDYTRKQRSGKSLVGQNHPPRARCQLSGSNIIEYQHLANEVNQGKLHAQHQDLGMEIYITVGGETLRFVSGWHHSTLIPESKGPRCFSRYSSTSWLWSRDGLRSKSMAIVILRASFPLLIGGNNISLIHHLWNLIQT